MAFLKLIDGNAVDVNKEQYIDLFNDAELYVFADSNHNYFSTKERAGFPSITFRKFDAIRTGNKLGFTDDELYEIFRFAEIPAK